MFVVDPPGAFADRAAWQAFRDQMDGLAKENPDDATVREGQRLAREWFEEHPDSD